MKALVTCDVCKQSVELDHQSLQRLIEQKPTFIICKDCQRKKDAEFIRYFRGLEVHP